MEHVVLFVSNINAIVDSFMLYIRHDFYNIILKIKHKLYIASGSASSSPGCSPETQILKEFFSIVYLSTGLSRALPTVFLCCHVDPKCV